MTIRVVSFGGGVQSTALAILNATSRVENPAAVCLFADTGNERPETYVYLAEVFTPWAAQHGLEIVTVRSDYGGGSVYADCWRRKDVPSVVSRVCTNMFKIRPIQRWLTEQGATATDPADVQIAISADEAHRAKRNKRDPRYLQKRWPLVSLGLTRTGCQCFIAEAGLPVPPKSSCFICPFASQAYWRYLSSVHPGLFSRAVALETRAQERKPGISLGGDKPLSRLLSEGRQVGFDEWLESELSCRSGYCDV